MKTPDPMQQDVPRGADWDRDGDPAAIAETLAMLDDEHESGIRPRDLFEAAVEAEGAFWRYNEMHCAALYGVPARALTPSALHRNWADTARITLRAVVADRSMVEADGIRLDEKRVA